MKAQLLLWNQNLRSSKNSCALKTRLSKALQKIFRRFAARPKLVKMSKPALNPSFKISAISLKPHRKT